MINRTTFTPTIAINKADKKSPPYTPSTFLSLNKDFVTFEAKKPREKTYTEEDITKLLAIKEKKSMYGQNNPVLYQQYHDQLAKILEKELFYPEENYQTALKTGRIQSSETPNDLQRNALDTFYYPMSVINEDKSFLNRLLTPSKLPVDPNVVIKGVFHLLEKNNLQEDTALLYDGLCVCEAAYDYLGDDNRRKVDQLSNKAQEIMANPDRKTCSAGIKNKIREIAIKKTALQDPLTYEIAECQKRLIQQNQKSYKDISDYYSLKATQELNIIDQNSKITDGLYLNKSKKIKEAFTALATLTEFQKKQNILIKQPDIFLERLDKILNSSDKSLLAPCQKDIATILFNTLELVSKKEKPTVEEIIKNYAKTLEITQIDDLLLACENAIKEKDDSTTILSLYSTLKYDFEKEITLDQKLTLSTDDLFNNISQAISNNSDDIISDELQKKLAENTEQLAVLANYEIELPLNYESILNCAKSLEPLCEKDLSPEALDKVKTLSSFIEKATKVSGRSIRRIYKTLQPFAEKAKNPDVKTLIFDTCYHLDPLVNKLEKRKLNLDLSAKDFYFVNLKDFMEAELEILYDDIKDPTDYKIHRGCKMGLEEKEFQELSHKDQLKLLQKKSLVAMATEFGSGLSIGKKDYTFVNLGVLADTLQDIIKENTLSIQLNRDLIYHSLTNLKIIHPDCFKEEQKKLLAEQCLSIFNTSNDTEMKELVLDS